MYRQGPLPTRCRRRSRAPRPRPAPGRRAAAGRMGRGRAPRERSTRSNLRRRSSSRCARCPVSTRPPCACTTARCRSRTWSWASSGGPRATRGARSSSVWPRPWRRISVYTAKSQMAHWISYSLFDGHSYVDSRGSSRANTRANTRLLGRVVFVIFSYIYIYIYSSPHKGSVVGHRFARPTTDPLWIVF